jgi:RNA polymerase sigma factor (sigma-70 family)
MLPPPAEGLVGLSKSLDRFDASKGFKFSTYAHWWIRQSISRAVCDQARVVRLPSHICETLYRINRAITTIVEQVGAFAC